MPYGKAYGKAYRHRHGPRPLLLAHRTLLRLFLVPKRRNDPVSVSVSVSVSVAVSVAVAVVESQSRFAAGREGGRVGEVIIDEVPHGVCEGQERLD
eukprot:1144153-Rhodomonas_salina.1